MSGKKYKNNFLKEVIFRVDFEPILELGNEIKSEFKDKIINDFPNFDSKDMKTVKLDISKNGEGLKKERVIGKLWQFEDESKTFKIDVSYQHIVAVTKEYKNFDEYRPVVEKVFESFLDAYSPIDINRVGMRYINLITLKKGNPFDWEGYIDDKLLCNFVSDTNELRQYINSIILSKDESIVKFTYGMPNSEFPAKISRKEFVLDIDCYTDFASEDSVIKNLIKYNDEITKIFEQSIGHKLREEMEVV